MPTSVWVSTTQDVGDGMTANVRADMDVESKNAVIDCRVNNGRDSVAVDFDTADSTMGPLRITKHLDLNGRKVGHLLLVLVVCVDVFLFVCPPPTWPFNPASETLPSTSVDLSINIQRHVYCVDRCCANIVHIGILL